MKDNIIFVMFVAIVVLCLALSYSWKVCNHTVKQVMETHEKYQLLDAIGPDKCKSYFMLTDSNQTVCDTVFNFDINQNY